MEQIHASAQNAYERIVSHVVRLMWESDHSRDILNHRDADELLLASDYIIAAAAQAFDVNSSVIINDVRSVYARIEGVSGD